MVSRGSCDFSHLGLFEPSSRDGRLQGQQSADRGVANEVCRLQLERGLGCCRDQGRVTDEAGIRSSNPGLAGSLTRAPSSPTLTRPLAAMNAENLACQKKKKAQSSDQSDLLYALPCPS